MKSHRLHTSKSEAQIWAKEQMCRNQKVQHMVEEDKRI